MKPGNFFVALAGLCACLACPSIAVAETYGEAFQQRYDSPQDVSALGRFVSKAVEVGQYDQAISTLEQHLIRYPRDARARFNLAKVYANTGTWQLVVRNLDIALSIGDLTPQETAQANALRGRAERALAGYEWVLDMTVGIRSTWLDVEDEANAWRDRQDWNPFAAVNSALKIDLDTPLDDKLIISASGLLERRYEDINTGGFDPFDGFTLTDGIHVHHRGRVAATLDKGVPVVEFDALRFHITGFAEFRTYHPSLTDIALGTTVRAILMASVDTMFYAEGTYANLSQSENLTADHRFQVEAGAHKRLSHEHAVGVAGRLVREITDSSVTVSRQREVEVRYAGVLPFDMRNVLWTHEAGFAVGDFLTREGGVLPGFVAAAGDGWYWRADWQHIFHLDGHNRINVGYSVREFDHDVGLFAFDPGALKHSVSVSFTKSF